MAAILVVPMSRPTIIGCSLFIICVVLKLFFTSGPKTMLLCFVVYVSSFNCFLFHFYSFSPAGGIIAFGITALGVSFFGFACFFVVSFFTSFFCTALVAVCLFTTGAEFDGLFTTAGSLLLSGCVVAIPFLSIAGRLTDKLA